MTAGNTHDLVGAADLLRLVPIPQRLIADRSYDAKKLREWLIERGCEPVIPPNPTRKHPASYDLVAYKARNSIERMFCRLKEFSQDRNALRQTRRYLPLLDPLGRRSNLVDQLSPDDFQHPTCRNVGEVLVRRAALQVV